MPLCEVHFTGDTNDPFMLDLYRYTHIFRVIGYEVKFGIISETNTPLIINAPLHIPSNSPFICLLSPPGKDMSISRGIFAKIQARILSLGELPALCDEFDNHQLLAAESIAHTSRLDAGHELDPERRKRKFKVAYDIYEGVIFALAHSSYTAAILSMRKGLKKITLTHPNAEILIFSPEGRRRFSHCFAGMAICVLMGEGCVIKYVSLVSMSVCLASTEHALQLACVLRLFPLLMVVPSSSVEHIMHATHMYRIHGVITEKIILPLLKCMGRDDLFAIELALLRPDSRAASAQFADDVARRIGVRMTSPAPLVTVSTRVVDGRILERNCAACGVWDRTGRSYHRCSRCMMVYYCGKECQARHWKEHKADCKKK
jgi:hypothetical protein